MPFGYAFASEVRESLYQLDVAKGNESSVRMSIPDLLDCARILAGLA